MVDPAIIEFANDAFYQAFNTRDIDQMSSLWSDDAICVCIHPGWPPIIGRDEVLQSWQQIFTNQPDGELQCFGARVMKQGDVYSVICYEKLPGGWLVATNNFLMEAGRARIVHHQASPCSEPPDIESATPTIQ